MSLHRLAPGAVIGVLGGGQLGRMLTLAAAKLGFDAHVFCPEDDAPAARVAARHTKADYRDAAALARFARTVDVVTAEFENVPAEAAEALLAAGALVRPGPVALATAQDRLIEKRFLARCGAQTPRFAPIDGPGDLAAALAEIGAPAVLKTRRFGYDGKGQAWIRDAAEGPAALAALAGAPAILEAGVDFACEISVVAARGADGAFVAYPASENRHQSGVLVESVIPAAAPRAALDEAAALTRAVAAELEYVGVLAIEFFLTREGRLIANEMAPRVHNSGHWTPEACACGQFEQHIRAITGWPLGDATPRARRVRMRNLLGAEASDWAALAQDRGASITLYGKRDAAPGRKMGHVVWLD